MCIGGLIYKLVRDQKEKKKGQQHAAAYNDPNYQPPVPMMVNGQGQGQPQGQFQGQGQGQPRVGGVGGQGGSVG